MEKFALGRMKVNVNLVRKIKFRLSWVKIAIGVRLCGRILEPCIFFGPSIKSSFVDELLDLSE